MASAPGFPPNGEIPSPGSEGGAARGLTGTGAPCPLSATLEASPDPALVATTTGTIVTVNEAFVSTWRPGTAGRLEGESLASDLRGRRRRAARRCCRSRRLLGGRTSPPRRRFGDRAAPLGPAAAGSRVLRREARRLRLRRDGGAPSRTGRGSPRDDPRRRPGRRLLRPPRRGAGRHAPDGDGRRRPPRRWRASKGPDAGRQGGRGAGRALYLRAARGAVRAGRGARPLRLSIPRRRTLPGGPRPLAERALQLRRSASHHGGRQLARPAGGPLPAASSRRRFGGAGPRALRGAGGGGDRATGSPPRGRTARGGEPAARRVDPRRPSPLPARGGRSARLRRSEPGRRRHPRRRQPAVRRADDRGGLPGPRRDSRSRRRTGRLRSEGAPWRSEEVTYADGRITGAFLVQAFQTAPSEMAAAFLDISARRRAEEAVREREARFERLNRMLQDLGASPRDPRGGARAGRAGRPRLRGARRGSRLRVRLGRPAGRFGERGPSRRRLEALRPGPLPDRPQDSPGRAHVREGRLPEGERGPGRFRARF